LFKFQAEWYDGNPSTYRNWEDGEPNDPDRCAAYTTNGFEDKACNEQHYYTCKKRIGNLSAFVTHSTVFIYSFIKTVECVTKADRLPMRFLQV